MKPLFYCPLPWNSIATRNSGEYRLCCYANVSEGRGLLRDEQGKSLSLRTTAWSEVRNHPLLKEVRADFLRGRWPVACGRCAREEDSGLASGREHALERLGSPALVQAVRNATAADGTIAVEEFALEDLDLRLGNTCNLRCRSCGPADSSAWTVDWEALGFQPLRESESASWRWHEGVRILDRLPQDLSKLKRIYLVGGEPMLIQEHFQLLEELVQTPYAREIALEYNTNLTVLPPRALELWSQFKKVGLGVSMDGFGRHHEYLRYPGKFATIERNLQQLDEAPETVSAWLACTVSLLNAAHLTDFMLWKARLGPCRINRSQKRPLFSLHPVHQPLHLSLREIPVAAKAFLRERLARGLSEIVADVALSVAIKDSARDTVTAVQAFMFSGDSHAPWTELWQKTLDLDHVRRTRSATALTFADLEPELFAICQAAASGPSIDANTVNCDS